MRALPSGAQVEVGHEIQVVGLTEQIPLCNALQHSAAEQRNA